MKEQQISFFYQNELHIAILHIKIESLLNMILFGELIEARLSTVILGYFSN